MLGSFWMHLASVRPSEGRRLAVIREVRGCVVLSLEHAAKM